MRAAAKVLLCALAVAPGGRLSRNKASQKEIRGSRSGDLLEQSISTTEPPGDSEWEVVGGENDAMDISTVKTVVLPEQEMSIDEGISTVGGADLNGFNEELVYAATPLLKFGETGPELIEAGLLKLMNLPLAVSVVAFVGDGRSGKSFLANKFQQALRSFGGASGARGYHGETIFLEDDSSKPVTRGVDLGIVTLGNRNVVILDCEGGNNAQAVQDGSNLASVVALAGATQVAFVTAGNHLQESFVDHMGRALAGRHVLPPIGLEALPPPDLRVVLNMKKKGAKASDLEEALELRHDGKDDTRSFIKGAVASQRLFELPDRDYHPELFDSSFGALRQALLDGAEKPLRIGGVPVNGTQLAELLRAVFEAAYKNSRLAVPSVLRRVVYDGVLAPLVDNLAAKYEGLEPTITAACKYRPGLQDTHQAGIEAVFDARVSHLHAAQLVEEARSALQTRMALQWDKVVAANEAAGLLALNSMAESLAVKYEGLNPVPTPGASFRPNLRDTHRKDIEDEFVQGAAMFNMLGKANQLRQELGARMHARWSKVVAANDEVGREVAKTDSHSRQVPDGTEWVFSHKVRLGLFHGFRRKRKYKEVTKFKAESRVVQVYKNGRVVENAWH